MRIEQGSHDWAAGSVEFVAIGTAVRLPARAAQRAAAPVLTDLDGQEFWQLCAAGIRPVGIAAHTSVHYVPATWQTHAAMGGGMFGGAARGTTRSSSTSRQGVYDAREKAMSYVSRPGRARSAPTASSASRSTSTPRRAASTAAASSART